MRTRIRLQAPGGSLNTTHHLTRRTRLAFVAGIAVLASVTAPLTTATAYTATTPVSKAGAENPAPVTVVQEGGPTDVATGDVPASKVRFTATLPAGFTGDVKAQLVFTRTPGAGWEPRQVASALDATCSLNGGPYTSCRFDTGHDEYTEGIIYLSLPTATATTENAGTTLTWQLLVSTKAMLADGLGGTINLTDAAGTALAAAPAQINFVEGRATSRPTIYARDTAGTLWQYESDGKYGTTAYSRRTKVGGGWEIYNTITRLGKTAVGSASTGVGHDLVARDKAGRLWFYRGTGQPGTPFKPRTLVGSGWGQYTAIVGMGDSRTDRVNDLLARDRDGVLWFYRGTGDPARPFKTRVKVGGGWNKFTSLTSFPNGIVAKDAAGVLWLYEANPTGEVAAPLKAPQKFGVGFGTYRALAFGDDLGWGEGKELVARDASGNLWAYEGSYSYPGKRGLTGKRTQIGTGWNIYNTLI